MSTLRDTPPEVQFSLLFPGQAIPDWALTKMEYLEVGRYIIYDNHKGVVPMAQIVGTSHAHYGNSLCWLEMLTIAQSSYNFELSNWPGFLEAITTDIVIARLDGTDKYYIIDEGNHRVTAHKLAGRLTISCSVAMASPDPNYTVQPIRLRSHY